MKIKDIFRSSLFIVFSLLLFSCKKDERKPPTVNFKTSSGYTSANAVVGMDSTIMVGIIADKVEDDMVSYNVSYAYDAVGTTTTDQNFSLTGGELQHYDKDVIFTTRSTAGTERWLFTITDKDGNIAQKQIVLTVQ